MVIGGGDDSHETFKKKDGRPMSVKLNLPCPEMDLLEALCDRKAVTKTALIRQAIRLFAECDGKKVTLKDKDGSDEAAWTPTSRRDGCEAEERAH